MPEDYTPNPPVAQKNHPPLPLQWAPYVMADGTITACIIHQVFPPSPDGKYYNCAVSILWPPKIGPDGLPHPGEVLRSGKVYKVETAQVLTSNCGPPYPG